MPRSDLECELQRELDSARRRRNTTLVMAVLILAEVLLWYFAGVRAWTEARWGARTASVLYVVAVAIPSGVNTAMVLQVFSARRRRSK
jgi:hypothetical protein